MIALSNGVDTVNPITATSYEPVSESKNIVHEIIGRASAPDYSLAGEGPRRGSIAVLFPTATAAEEGRQLLATDSVFTLADSTNPTVDMTFIRQGAMRVRRGQFAGSWVLEIGFQEVAS